MSSASMTRMLKQRNAQSELVRMDIVMGTVMDKDSFKMTTVSLSWNPSLKNGKFMHSGTLGLAKSYYSKTIIVEEEAESGKTSSKPSKNFLLQEEHEHEEEITEEGEDLGTGDREFDRYSASTSVNYKLAKSILVGGGLGLAIVKKQFGPTQMETNATIAKGTYIWNSVSTTLSLGVSASKETFSVPNSPFASLSLFYNYE